jgi:hypothetical protein
VQLSELRGGWIQVKGVPRSGGAVGPKIKLLTNTTPALRATPPQLRRGFFASLNTLCAKPAQAVRPLGKNKPGVALVSLA